VDNFVRFDPDPRFTTIAAVALAAAVGGGLLVGDAPGRVLLGTAAVVLGAYVFADLLFRPRLVVSPAGVVINSPLTRVRLAWPQIEAVRTDVRLRLGLRSTTLEIDAGETLAVFSRRTLGRDPAEAAEVIRRYWS
jgi:hypothetical protein